MKTVSSNQLLLLIVVQEPKRKDSMYTYFKKLFVCLEAISHPAGSWWRKNAEAGLESEPGKTTEFIIPSPDRVDVRATSGKKDNSPRYSPAP